MKVLYLNAGNETGGGMHHILRMLDRMNKLYPGRFHLGLMEKKVLYERAVAKKIETTHFETAARLTPLMLRMIAAFIKAHQFTHVHTHGPRANVYMSWIQPFVNVKWVATIHSNPLEDFKERGVYGKLLTSMHVHALRHVHHIIAVSETTQAVLKQTNCKDKQMKVIHNGIDFLEPIHSIELSREKLGFSHHDFLVVQVARLHPIKAHQVAFMAIKQVHDVYPFVHLLLLGDGPMKNKLKKMAADLGMSEYIHFIGEINEPDVYFELADITLLTSLSETFPYVLLESARMETPIISTAVGDINHLIDHKDKGWMVPVNDKDAIASALKEAVQQKAHGNLEITGKNLQKKASAHFSLDKCVQEVYNVYEAL